ncbi:MAG: hypothetical protein KGL39_22585 [Patescibacteria group bacterium]|nr:hypothetical protein [Patescibacteria group bacterium]
MQATLAPDGPALCDRNLVAEFDRAAKALPPKPARKVFLACPHYGPVEPESAFAVSSAARQKGVLTVSMGGSLLARGFNSLWCQALNTRAEHHWTHFVMIHADIDPEYGWLTKLLDEMDRVGADVISAVVPIKDMTGDSSTAVLDPVRKDVRRLNERDLEQLPATFDGSHFRPDETLLVNTGLLAVRFDDPWVEHCWFEIVDRIEKLPDGTFEPRGMSEDWNFSQQCKALRKRVFATQIIGLKHIGRMAFERKAREV